MQTLLLTGGTGFFGRSILDAYRRDLLAPFGIGRVIALARHASQMRTESPELCGVGVELIDADVLKLSSIFDADVVIHAAASSEAQRYQNDPSGEVRIIVDGTRRVCEAIVKSRLRPQLLYVSSGAVYGRQPPGVLSLAEQAAQVADSDPVKEAYTQAKRAAEAVVSELSDSSRVPTRIARCFSFVGPWLPRDQHFAIGNFIGNALRGESIEVRSRHPVIRSYLHADDLAVWLLRIATSEGDGTRIFNVGSDESVSIRDLASLVGAVGGVGVSFPESVPGYTRGVIAQTDRYVPDIGKVRRELGLAVTIPLRTAVERTLQMLAATAPQQLQDEARKPARVRG